MNDDGRRPPTPTPDKATDEQLASTRTYQRWFMLLLLGTLLTSNLMLPWKLLGLILGMAALTMGILALVKAVRHKLPTFLKITTVIGLAATLFLTLGTAASVLLWPITAEYEECMRTALTNAAQRTCTEQLSNLGGMIPTQ